MRQLILIAGPCVIESEDLVMSIAEHMKKITEDLPIDYYFKASFDKANRTSLSSFRGPGLEKGMEILAKVKQTVGVKIATDIHEPWQAPYVAKTADIIQIPAFLCRQTDLLVAAAKTRKKINVKKAQFLAPEDMCYVTDKLVKNGNSDIMLCERGSCFGYGNLVVDMTGLIKMRTIGFPVIFDATHSVQKSQGSFTGGSREYIPGLVRAATAVGIDGLFMETHPDPKLAKSDGANMVRLTDMRQLLINTLMIRDVVGEMIDE